jgi:hypothetical protein
MSRYAYISATSNTVVKTGPGKLYSINGTFPTDSVVRIDDTHRFAQGILDINAVSSNTVTVVKGATNFTIGVGLDTGLVVAVSSNAKVTLEYD